MLERVADVHRADADDERRPISCGPASRDLWHAAGAGPRRSAGWAPGVGEAVEILTGPARTILDRWFESEELKATLATDAIIGALAAPSMPGTAYVLFHHVMGETTASAACGATSSGGMGGLTQALAAAARERGAEIRSEAEVARILVADGAATGVALASGDEYRAPIVASNADAHVTFRSCSSPRTLPRRLRWRRCERIGYESASLKINVALSELPNFRACPGTAPGPQHRGTDPHLPRPGLHRARLRRRQVRPAVDATRCWSARCRRRSIRAWRRRAST